MNEKNYDYLKNQIKFSGFGEELGNQLKEKIGEQAAAFSLQHQTRFGQDDVRSTLHFSRSKESDLYFFNKYDVEIQKTGQEQVLKQTYYVGKENNLTLKERYNQLDGRAVFKEFNRLEQVGTGQDAKWQATDQTYKAWVELNFKNTDDQGNFLSRKLFWDHEKALDRFPIKELADNYERSRLLASLEKGNVQRATATIDGQDIKVHIAANPQLKSFNFFDANLQKLEVKPVQQEKEQQQQAERKSETVKQAENEQKQGRKKQVKIS
ncbi:hypothetical protein [Mucilaginibacter terrae]|uniref:DUF3945 domain-containing protein n=1 Tax=Mucilaginibacter terrae TaxID=1955052 RepID=A0ABU3GRX7_9SPHI|nr:hypothetical protein [Mucilaginibacter terrae]MDT3402326.1 hypothetical protein [Mucilaginibacter terrae]